MLGKRIRRRMLYAPGVLCGRCLSSLLGARSINKRKQNEMELGRKDQLCPENRETLLQNALPFNRLSQYILN